MVDQLSSFATRSRASRTRSASEGKLRRRGRRARDRRPGKGLTRQRDSMGREPDVRVRNSRRGHHASAGRPEKKITVEDAERLRSPRTTLNTMVDQVALCSRPRSARQSARSHRGKSAARRCEGVGRHMEGSHRNVNSMATNLTVKRRASPDGHTPLQAET